MADAEPSLHDNLIKVKNSHSIEEFVESIAAIVEIVDYIGASHLMIFSKREELVNAVEGHAVKERLRTPFTQFSEGISTLGVLNAIKLYPELMETLFVAKDKRVKLEDIPNRCTVSYIQVGSNKNIMELETYAIWLDYLEELEEDEKLHYMLSFVTGLTSIPPLGFDPPLTISFIPQETEEHLRGIPYANTCANQLSLPVGLKYNEFCKVMNTAILEIGRIFTNSKTHFTSCNLYSVYA